MTADEIIEKVHEELDRFGIPRAKTYVENVLSLEERFALLRERWSEMNWTISPDRMGK